jgi:hypothetical protein
MSRGGAMRSLVGILLFVLTACTGGGLETGTDLRPGGTDLAGTDDLGPEVHDAVTDGAVEVVPSMDTGQVADAAPATDTGQAVDAAPAMDTGLAVDASPSADAWDVVDVAVDASPSADAWDVVDVAVEVVDVAVEVVDPADAIADLLGDLPPEIIVPPPPELVAWYRFEDPDAAQIQDSSIYGNHGEPAPELIRGVAGRVGLCVRFDGVDANVVVPHSESLDLVDALTLEAWVYLDTPDNWNKMLVRKYLQYQMSVSVVPLPGLLEFYSQPLGFARNDDPVDFGRWVHAAVSWDGGIARLYLDGVLAKAVPMEGAVLSKGTVLYLGSDGLNGSSPFGGIDEVKIWSVVRSEQEICEDGTGAWVPDADPPCVY